MKCKLCNHNTTSYFDKRIQATFYWCSYCDFIFKDEKDYVDQIKEKEIYDYHQNSIEDEKYVAYLDKFIQKGILPFVGEGKRGLDFGSGPTPVLSTILKDVYHYRMSLYDLFYFNKAENLEKQYDFICSTEVIEHLKEPLEYFSKFSKMLSTKGVLAIMTLLHPSSVEELQNWHYTRDRSHISLFSYKTLEYIAHTTGFRIVYTDHHRIITFVKEEEVEL